ncbi:MULTISPECIES: hypothetical protein [Mycobacteroides]|uniref:hypothetical protein n=1 Tax=Mycobacteroides TaxID=670516 RepID=UPI000715AC58|nr:MULTISPECIES: hypothetical protein [Mycobacteroides]KRQ20069.1 hypothetical protein AOT91_27510 [Mycobacteroides sp. H092]KRQ41833.1 hypothetical protein AOT92_10280 [Mycobacteroides sp. H101]KRQ50309.1 hypothetical protein AOT88_09280 [Mycobacteroides sp. H063]KRQ56539.1 hypothetical protein AOT94_21020 [Mycobacteroides sp. HXVII]KRQ59185.1 hypothetical protein AOT90_23350 [Mycobacteroides sp. H079]
MSDESGYGMVMPFVACQSNGGEYEDNAYVAGYEAGILEGQLYGWSKPSEDRPSPGLPTQWRYIHEGNVNQIDLIAMKHGWRVEHRDAVDGWVAVRLVDPDDAATD